MSRTVCLLLIVVAIGWISGGEKIFAEESPQARLRWFLGDEEQERSVQQLIDQLDADSFIAREVAARKLAALPSLPALARRLASSDDRLEVRARLSQIVKLHPVGKETEELNTILRQIADDGIDGTLGTLARIVGSEVWEPDPATLARAARVTVTQEDIPLLKESLGGQSAAVRRMAAAAYGGLPGEDAAAQIRRLLKDADETIALQAAEELARRKDIASLAGFARLLDSNDFSTRHRSWSALKNLSDQSFGFDPSAKEEERQAAARKWQEWGSGGAAAIVGELPETSVIALFNGRDLNGWTVFENGAAAPAQKTWETRDGALISVGQGFGDIRTNTVFENYVLTMKYKIVGAFGDGGIGVMLTKENEDRAVGLRRDTGSYLEVQLLPKRTGDLYLINGFQAKSGGRAIQFSSPRTAEADDRSGKWHELKLTVRDGTAEIELNGTVVNRATDGSKGPGKIVLRNEGARIMYKDILVLPVSP